MKRKKTSILPLFKAIAAGTITLACVLSPALAQETAEPVSITLVPNAGQTLRGKTFVAHRLFDVVTSADQSSVHYTWNEAYRPAIQAAVGAAKNQSPDTVREWEAVDYIAGLDAQGPDSSLRFFVEALRDQLESESGTRIEVDELEPDGSVVIRDLAPGWYLVDEHNVYNNDMHSAASLCLAASANADIRIQIKSDYPDLIKKIEEDDQGIGWNDIGDFEIGQTIPFRYETKVPAMAGYDTYSLVFHDKMDPALDADLDSVRIAVMDGERSVPMPESAFRVETGVEGETFQVVVPDLKAFVDEVFGQDARGQTIVVRYDARLNETAADQTGRPGFENAVRLEFSNNPDSDGKGETGFTPWDTVVCFTYRLEGAKVNEAGTRLEGARFRLYRDEACADEVRLKKIENGYVATSQEGEEMVSDAEGRFSVFGLDQGTYYLKETKAPDGYRPLPGPIRLTLTPTFPAERDAYRQGEGATDRILTKLEAEVSFPQDWNGKTELDTDSAAGSALLEVVNQTGATLPKTGSALTIVLLSAGSLLIWAGRKARRKDRDEEAK